MKRNPRETDQEFESPSLQRGVSNEPGGCLGEVALGICICWLIVYLKPDPDTCYLAVGDVILPRTRAKRMHVLICGGGVIGASIAYFLSCRGLKATVIESTGLACAASG